MKKFDTLDNQEKLVNQQVNEAKKESSTVGLSPKKIIIIVAIAVIIIAVLCIILFGGSRKTSSATVPTISAPSYNINPNSNNSGADSEDSIIPYSGSNAATVATDMRESESLKPDIIEYEYCVDNGFLFYYVKLYNPSSKNILEFPTVRVSARDADGVLLGNQEMVFHRLYPGQEANYSDQSFSVDEEPATVTVEALTAQDYQIMPLTKAAHKEYIPLEVTGVAIRNDNIVGEIINNNDYDITSARVSLIIRDSSGKMVGAEMAFVDNVPSKGRTPFSAFAWGLESNVTVEAYAEDWGF